MCVNVGMCVRVSEEVNVGMCVRVIGVCVCAVCVNVGMCVRVSEEVNVGMCVRVIGVCVRFGSRASLVRVSESASVCQST